MTLTLKELKANASDHTIELNPDVFGGALYPRRTIDYGEQARQTGNLSAAAERALSVPLEHDEQVALFQWADAMEAQYPELAMLHANPNGGYRPMATAARLKAEGVKAGIPDVHLPVARGRWHGLWIELKRADHSNGPTYEQKLWIDMLRHYGSMAVVAYGCSEAQGVIMAYLEQEGI